MPFFVETAAAALVSELEKHPAAFCGIDGSSVRNLANLLIRYGVRIPLEFLLLTVCGMTAESFRSIVPISFFPVSGSVFADKMQNGLGERKKDFVFDIKNHLFHPSLYHEGLSVARVSSAQEALEFKYDLFDRKKK